MRHVIGTTMNNLVRVSFLVMEEKLVHAPYIRFCSRYHQTPVATVKLNDDGSLTRDSAQRVIISLHSEPAASKTIQQIFNPSGLLVECVPPSVDWDLFE